MGEILVKKVVKSKKKIIIGAVIIIILLSVTLVLICWPNRNETENKSDDIDINIITSDDHSDDELGNEETNNTDTKNESGLDIVETPSGNIDNGVDGSGSWDDKGATNDSTSNEKNDVDTNILVDDKVWGDVK